MFYKTDREFEKCYIQRAERGYGEIVHLRNKIEKLKEENRKIRE